MIYVLYIMYIWRERWIRSWIRPFASGIQISHQVTLQQFHVLWAPLDGALKPPEVAIALGPRGWELGMAWHDIHWKQTVADFPGVVVIKISRRWNEIPSIERYSSPLVTSPSFMRDGFAMLRLGHPNTEREVTTKRIKVLFVYFATFWKALKG